jgi:glutamate-1-semialdehyde aminotransferase
VPYLSFADETDHQFMLARTAECAARGVFVHPKHNWFMSTALSEADVDSVLVATDGGLRRGGQAVLVVRAVSQVRHRSLGQPAGVTAIGAR